MTYGMTFGYGAVAALSSQLLGLWTNKILLSAFQFRDCNATRERMLLSGGQGNGVFGRVGGLNADHLEPAVWFHVGKCGGKFGPGIPDDGGF